MHFFTTPDGIRLFYKDLGPRDATPLVFHHGWPLSADEWDAQLLYLLAKGYRVIAHDRRGHGRSEASFEGNDMDTYAADVAALVAALDLKGAVHIGHSTGGGEAARYVASARPGTVAKLVLICAVTPVMVRKAGNPAGLPIELFDGFRKALAENRAQFYLDIASGPFYGFNREGAKVSPGLIQNWFRQGMMGDAKSQYDCIKAFSETDFTDDLARITVPTLVLHGTDDQVVPYANAGPRAAKMLKHGTPLACEGLPHGMATSHAARINADILAFLEA